MKFHAALQMIAALGLVAAGPVFADQRVREIEKGVAIEGRALFSFNTDHFMIQTDHYIYKVAKKDLSSEIQKLLTDASIQNLDVKFQIPTSSITYSWPVGKNQISQAGKYISLATELVSEAKLKDGTVSLSGMMVHSFSDPYFLIQVNESIYQLKKSTLTDQQITALSKSVPGSKIEIAVPEKSVDLAWTYKNISGRNVASIPVSSEGYSVRAEVATIVGKMLPSFEDPLVLVQSKNAIFQIQRRKLSTKSPNLLDKPGSSITLSVPLDGVVMIWPADPVQMLQPGIRAPASHHP